MAKHVSKYCLLFNECQAHEDGIWSLACRATQGDGVQGGSASDDSRREVVVTAGIDGSIKIWDLKDDSLKVCRVLKGHDLGVLSVAFNKEGTMLASTAMDASLRLWSAASGKCLSTMEIGPKDACNAAFTHDSQFVVTGSHHGKVRMYNVKSKLQERQLVSSRGVFLLTVAVSASGQYIASADQDGHIYIFEYATGKMLHDIIGHAKPVRFVTFSPDSKTLLSCSEDYHMKMFEVESGKPIAQMSGHSSWVLSAAFSSDGRLYASAGADKSVKIWESSTHRCLHTFREHQEAVWGVGFNTDCNRVISVSEDTTINVLALPTYHAL